MEAAGVSEVTLFLAIFCYQLTMCVQTGREMLSGLHRGCAQSLPPFKIYEEARQKMGALMYICFHLPHY